MTTTATVEVEQLFTTLPAPNCGWLPLNTIMHCFSRGDTGDAEILARLFRGKILFDRSDGYWYIFDSHAWVKDRLYQVSHLVSGKVADQYVHAANEMTQLDGVHHDVIRDIRKRYSELQYRTRIDTVLEMGTREPDLAITGDEWHQNPLLIACPNGVLDLGTDPISFRPGQPEDYLRSTVPTPWLGIDTPAPRWNQFLLEIFGGNAELVAFIQRLFGYGLTGLATEDKFPVLWGEGRNGKDTLLETIEYVLSNAIAAPVQSEVLVNTDKNANAATPHLIALRNRRIVWVNETNEGARINAGQVKLLTGGGTIAARPLYGQATEFKPTHLILLMTNHKPHTGDDDAVWKRLLLIPFNQKFIENPTAPNEHLRDPNLSKTLQSEAPGILAWIVKGVTEWREKGLAEPREVSMATQDYKSKEDTIGLFISECCVTGPGYSESATILYDTYRDWSEDSGLGRGMTKTAFGERIIKRFEREHRRSGNAYIGISVRK